MTSLLIKNIVSDSGGNVFMLLIIDLLLESDILIGFVQMVLKKFFICNVQMSIPEIAFNKRLFF